MFIRSASFFALLMVLSTGLGATAQPLNRPLNRLSTTIDSDSTIPLGLIAEGAADRLLPGFVSRRIQKDLGERLNVPFHELVVVEATPQVWPDVCLGIANPDEICAQKNVRGWQVVVNSSQQLWTYRSDHAAQRLRLMSANTTEFNRREFSAAIAQKILETASQQVQEPIDNLQVLSVQSATWDGCLGIAAPDQSCTKNVVPGFRVIVGSEPRAVGSPGGREEYDTENVPKEWVYHISEDGLQLVQNAAANNTKPLVSTFLLLPSTPIPEMGSDVFSLMSDHLYGGFRSTITLTADGTIYYELFNDLKPEESTPKEALSQISLEEVSELKALLKQQRFSNFDRMYYSNEDPAVSTREPVVLTAAGASVGFNVEAERLPALLHLVVAMVAEIVI